MQSETIYKHYTFEYTQNTQSANSVYRNQPDDYKFKNDSLPVISEPNSKKKRV
jgi:hypothetical protein